MQSPGGLRNGKRSITFHPVIENVDGNLREQSEQQKRLRNHDRRQILALHYSTTILILHSDFRIQPLLFHYNLISDRLFRIRFFSTTSSCRAAFLEFRTIFHNRSQTDSPESGFPPQRSLVGLSSLNSAPYFTAEVNLTHPNPVYPPTTAHVVLTFPNPAHHNRPHVVRPPSNFGSSCSTETLLYAVTSCLQVYPSAATSPVGPLGRTPFSPPPSTSQSGSDRPKKEAGATNAPASLPNATLSTKSTCRADPESWPSAE